MPWNRLSTRGAVWLPLADHGSDQEREAERVSALERIANDEALRARPPFYVATATR